jgi:hypothetical protein
LSSISRKTKNDGDAYVSKYQITEYPQAFRLDGGSDRVPVTVEQHPHCLAVRYLDPATGQERWYCLGFFEFRTLVQDIIWGLLLGREKHATWHAWTTIQIDRALRHRIYQQWQRLLQRVDPAVLAVQRKLYAATLRCAPLALRAELYRHPYLVKDIATYRAAAMAVILACDMAKDRGPSLPREPFGLICPEGVDTSTEASLALMHNWRGLFSPTGSPYRSLNRTLMQLPGGVPYGLVGKLSRVYLQRPLVQRIELIVVTYLTERREPSPNLPIFHQARAPQIKEAMEQVAAYGQ